MQNNETLIDKSIGYHLIVAVSCYNKEDVVKLIKMGADVNTVMTRPINTTPAIEAVKYGYIDILQILINAGADIYLQGENGFTIMHVAASHGKADILEYLIDLGMDTNVLDNNMQTPLHLASLDNDIEMVKILCGEENTNIDAVDVNGKTAVFICCEEYWTAGVEYLGDIGANLDIECTDGIRPCEHVIGIFNGISIFNALISRGAEVDYVNKFGDSLLFVSCIHEVDDYALNLIDSGCDVNISNTNGITPLYVTTIKNRKALIRSLVDKGADPNKGVSGYNDNTITPFHNACQFCDKEIVELLLDNGANINNYSINKEYPIHIAARRGSIEIVDLLLKNKDDINRTKHGSKKTPLMIACKYQNHDLIKFLIMKGANYDPKPINNNKYGLFMEIAKVSDGSDNEFLIDIIKETGTDPFIVDKKVKKRRFK